MASAPKADKCHCAFTFATDEASPGNPNGVLGLLSPAGATGFFVSNGTITITLESIAFPTMKRPAGR